MTFYQSQLHKVKSECYSNKEQLKTVKALRNYLENSYYDDLNLNTLSKKLFTSKYHLLRLFKKYYGQTPRQYLMDKRIEKSKQYLNQGMTVTDTCYAVGFESLGSFSTLFKSRTGKSPKAYQKEQFSRKKLE